MDQLFGQAQQDSEFDMISFNIVVTLQQIPSEIPFNIFINGIKEKICAQKMGSQYEDTIQYQLGSGDYIKQQDSRSLKELGFTNNCTLYVRLQLKGGPNYSNLQLNDGNELYQQKRYDEEIKFFDEAIELNPNNAENYYAKGKALLAMNRKDEAIVLYEQAYEKFKEFFLQTKRKLNMFGE